MELQMIQIVALLAIVPVAAQQPAESSLQRTITIGGVFNSQTAGEKFTEIIKHINIEPGVLPPGIKFNSSFILWGDNPIEGAYNICDSLIPHEVYVVIASNIPHSSITPHTVSFISNFYSIPVIGIAAKGHTFSDEDLHPLFMRTVAPYTDQIPAWIEMVVHHGWEKVILIHSSNEDGQAMLTKFRMEAKEHRVKMEKHIQYHAGQMDFNEEFLDLMTAESTVIFLYASEEDAEHIYENAKRFNLTGAGYVWIVTEQALLPANVPIGILGVKEVNSNKEEAHINDSVHLFAKALTKMLKHGGITVAPSQCTAIPKGFVSGSTLFSYMKKVVMENGATGKLVFNEVGDRMNPVYKIINIQPGSTATQQVEVGTYTSSKPSAERLDIHEGDIIWPGNQITKPKGIRISSHLKVVSLQSTPFLYTKQVPSGGVCEIDHQRIPCSQASSTTGEKKHFCCYGYVTDLLQHLCKTLNLTYELYLVEDNKYGSYERVNGPKKQWNGIIGELVNGEADLSVAPLTINPERARHIDFSVPFKYQGFTILVRERNTDSSLVSFLQPFQDSLWLLIILCVHVVAIVLYFLDSLSPFTWFKLDKEKDSFNLLSAIWLSWEILLKFGRREDTPKTFSARVLSMVWACFAMVTVASYTSNLIAFLVMDRPEPLISGINDARLRNPYEGFWYATVKNSAVSMYFKRHVELSTMYRTMENRNYDTAEQAIQDVKEGKLQAFLWDSSRLEYEAANDCNLVTAGNLFGKSGYGIGLPKGSPWTQKISSAILTFHEKGFMEQLDGKWIHVTAPTKCPVKGTLPATLGLTNMASAFVMVAVGILIGIFLVCVEVACKRHSGRRNETDEVNSHALTRSL